MTSISWPERYALARSILFAQDTVANGSVHPVWIDDERFWYERKGPEGREYRLVLASSGEHRRLVTVNEIVASLGEHLGVKVDGELLNLVDLTFDAQGTEARFIAFGEAYSYRLAGGGLTAVEKRSDPNWLASPDGATAAFLRDGNIWAADRQTHQERPLTTDGVEFYAYGDVPASRRAGLRRLNMAVPEAIWSPDSRWLLTLQVDDRQVPDLAYIEFAPVDGLRPRVHSNKTSLPEDPKPTEFRMLALEVKTGRQVEARYPRLAAVRMNDTPFTAKATWWSEDSQTAYFVDLERGEKAAHVVAFDVSTGSTRVVFSETADTYLELGVNVYTPANVFPIPGRNELLWYSERSGHGHLYLYDLVTGALKHPVTAGPWQVREVLSVDTVRREVFFTAGGIAGDEDPYMLKPCVASLDGDGTQVRVVSSQPGEHIVWRPGEMATLLVRIRGLDGDRVSGLSPGGDYFVETVGLPTGLTTTSLRRRTGELIAVLETADGADLPAGWRWPEPVRCKAADGVTDTYGLLFQPADHAPGEKRPVIDYIYGGPQVSNVPKGSFVDGSLGGSAFLEAAHLAALGAYVLILDGRGTAFRERAFREASYGAVQTASDLEDHIAAVRDLAQTHDLDLDRVGICGFSGGGYMTALAALRFGDVFKVAVAGGGNYDQALFWHSWGERYHGPYEADAYAAQAAKTYAAGMTGKLLLIHGMMDTGCHPSAFLQLVQALIEADKDPDLIVLPRAGHELTGYGVRRRLDYFVTHLFGGTPPPAEPIRLGSDSFQERILYNAARPEPSA
ncbi:MAG TPA: DPP IV N-terminal domain-containing protein [Caulobacteraceae bacterium]|jgi:dipeptidyl aminopeptidase/acylaminoacyl peptidase|nr:DPP IV N-terminal domain-containing protein [Caulobacteraceae bacterium]